MWDSPFMQCSDCHFHGWDMVGLKYIETIPKKELLIEFSTSEIIYPLVMTNSLLLNMAHLYIVDFPIEHGDFPSFFDVFCMFTRG